MSSLKNMMIAMLSAVTLAACSESPQGTSYVAVATTTIPVVKTEKVEVAEAPLSSQDEKCSSLVSNETLPPNSITFTEFQKLKAVAWKDYETCNKLAWEVYRTAEVVALRQLRTTNFDMYIKMIDAEKFGNYDAALEMGRKIPAIAEYNAAKAKLFKVYSAKQLAAFRVYQREETALFKAWKQ